MAAPFIFIPALLIITITMALLIGYFMKTRNQERVSMIERGIDPDKDRNISEHRKQTILKNGILFVFFGFGLLIAQLLVKQFEVLDEFITYVTMFLIFGGAGFLLSYLITKNPSD